MWSFGRAPNPTDLILRAAPRRGASKDGPVCSFVCASWSVPFDKLRTGFRGRCAAPQDEVVGSYNGSDMAPQVIEIAQNRLGNDAAYRVALSPPAAVMTATMMSPVS